jgi:hypothetical protein
MLTRAPVWRLLLYYVAVNLLLAAVLAAVTALAIPISEAVTGEPGQLGPTGELIVGFLALLVSQDWPTGGITQFSGFAAIQAITGIIGIILPALLLGAVVFRVMTPKSDMVRFNPGLYLEDADGTNELSGPVNLVSTFYIPTPVRCFDLSVSLHMKYFKRNKRGEPDREERFPWHSVALGSGLTTGDNLALPYDLIPTRFRAEAVVFRDREAFDAAVQVTQKQGTPLILIEGGLVRHVFVDGRHLRSQDDDSMDYCDLMVVVSGSLPDAQAELKEVHRYDLFRDFRDMADASSDFDVEYVRRNDDYYVSRIGTRHRNPFWTLLRRLRGPRHF